MHFLLLPISHPHCCEDPRRQHLQLQIAIMQDLTLEGEQSDCEGVALSTSSL